MSTAGSTLTFEDRANVATEVNDALEPRNSTLPMEVARRFSEGLELMNHGEPAAAASCFEQVVRVHPDFADAHVGPSFLTQDSLAGWGKRDHSNTLYVLCQLALDREDF